MKITKEAKRYLLTLSILLCLLVVIALPVIASDTTGAKYTGVIQISNNGTTVSGVSVNISQLRSDALVAMGMAAANLTDTAILNNAVDTAFMPGYDTSPWITWVDTIGEDTNRNQTLWTDNASGGKIRYFPGAAGMEIVDHEDLEPSDNFSVRVKGRFDSTAAASKDLINHYDTTNGGVQLFVSPDVSENYTGRIMDLGSEAVQTNYTTTSDHQIFSGTNWESQTFTLTETIEITQISILCKRVLTPGSVNASIKNVVASKPSGADLTSGLADGNGWAVGIEWNTVDLPDTTLEAGSYALVLRAITGDGANYIDWEDDNAGPTYTGGSRVHSANSGTDWTVDATIDFDFRIYGRAIEPVAVVSATDIESGELEIELELDAALDFDGDNDLVTVVDAASITNIFDGGGTIAAWINPDSDGEGHLGMILRKSAADGWLINVASEASGNVSLNFDVIFSGTNGAWVTTVPVVELDTWTFVAVVYNSDATGNNPTIYVDDVAYTVASGITESNTPVGTRVSDTGTDLYIGNASAGSRTFDGGICEGRLYDDGLTNAEIIECSNGVYTDDTNLVAYWKIDEGTGNTIADSSGEGNTGTNNGATWASPGLLKINIDSVQEGVAGGVSVPNSSANWTLCEAAATPYVEYTKILIGGVLQSHIEWEYDTTFSDISGNSHDATPTFRTTSSDADVSATLLSFGPVSEAKADVLELYDPVDILTGDPTAPSQLYTDLDTSKIIGGEAVDAMLAASDTPKMLWWFPFIFIGICIIGFLVYGATQMRGATGSLLTMAIVIEVLLLVMGVMNPISLVPTFLFPIAGVAIVMSQKHKAWG